ncbi:MAG: hypothetical protein GY943_13105 [Chloroflexi bacterium]|nr:hypothetical protein [Chloroflexota bacterium]
MKIKNTIERILVQQVDKIVLYGMNKSVPASLEASYPLAPSLEDVLAATDVDIKKTAVSQLTAPGEHTIWLNTPLGEMKCHVRVRLAIDPTAPLLIYHPGFNELPYTNSWRRIFPVNQAHPYHLVCIQAPYHTKWGDPLTKGFASVAAIYQIFAGSLRMMAQMQSAFTAEGAAFTMLTGISWGGITSILYEALFGSTAAVVTLLSSPRLDQAMHDIATMFSRPTAVTPQEMATLFDFTPYYEQCDKQKLFPLLGQDDQYFQYEKHAAAFGERPLTTVPGGHLSAMWHQKPLQAHIQNVWQHTRERQK